MVIVGILSWWYTAGWRRQMTMLRNRLMSAIDYFSIDLLLRTFFSPFRQISAGRVDGPLAIKMRAFFDRLISRVIGAIVRSVMIVAGIVTIFVTSLIGGLSLVVWACVPLVPIVCIVLFIVGWTPWNL